MDLPETKKLYIFVDESGVHLDSSLLYMAIVVTDSPDTIRKECELLIEKITNDPELSQNIPSVRKNGIIFLHYVADHPEVRGEVVKLLPTLNFDGYVIFARKVEIEGDLSKVELLRLLLENLLRPRLLEKYYADIQIVYERFDEGSSVVEKDFSDAVELLSKQLSGEFGKCINNVSVSFDNKDELCLGVSDYLCGIVSEYFNLRISGENVTDSWQERNYYRVAGKIRMIHDLTRKRFYSRQDPLDIESL